MHPVVSVVHVGQPSIGQAPGQAPVVRTPISQLPRGSRSRELAARIRRDIDSGALPIGSRLPSVTQLASSDGIGINTVRRAIGELVGDGLLDRRQGAGTFVVANSADRRPLYRLGVLVPSLTYYYPQVIGGIEHAASRQNASVVVACSSYGVDTELTQLSRLLDARVDGLLLVPNLHHVDDPAAHLDRLRELPIPYVLVERRPPPAPGDRTSSVCTDTMSGAYTAIAHLAGLGRRRIGYVGYLSAAPSAAVWAGYRQAVRDFDLEPVDGSILRRTVLSYQDLDKYARACGELRLDAVFCVGDQFAVTLVGRLRRTGMAVPEQVAVVGFDDEYAHTAEVPVTAVSPPKFELGRVATELLLRQLQLGADAVPHQVQLQPRLIVRSSCGGVATQPADILFEATG